MKKKILSILLAVVMLISVLPINVFASSPASGILTLSGTDYSESNWNYSASTHTLTLNGATLSQYDYIKMSDSTPYYVKVYGTNNINTKSNYGIVCANDINIDGTGTLNITNSSSVLYKDSTENQSVDKGLVYGIRAVGVDIKNITLNITNSDYVGTTTSTANGNNVLQHIGNIGIYGTHNITLTNVSGTIKSGYMKGNSGKQPYGSMAICLQGASQYKLHFVNCGHLILSAGNAVMRSWAIRATNAPCIVDGGYYEFIAGVASSFSSTSVMCENSDFTLNSGEVVCKSAQGGSLSLGLRCTQNININDGIVTVMSGKAPTSMGINATGLVIINGGMITASCDMTATTDCAAINAGGSSSTTGGLTSGSITFSNSIIENCEMINGTNVKGSGTAVALNAVGTPKKLYQANYSEPLRIGEIYREMTFVNNNENGTATIKQNGVEITNGTMVKRGTVLTLDATPNFGYKAVWTLNGQPYNESTYTVGTEPFELSVTYEQIPVMNASYVDPVTGETVELGNATNDGVAEVVDALLSKPMQVPNNIFLGWYTGKGALNKHTTRFDTFTNVTASFAGITPIAKDPADEKMVDDYLSFELVGAQIRRENTIEDDESATTDKEVYGGLRYISSFEKDLYNTIGKSNVIEYGILLASKDNAKLFADHYGVPYDKYEIQYNNGDDVERTAETDFRYVTNVVCSGLEDHRTFDNYRLFTAVIDYEGAEELKGTEFVARSYIKYRDANGVERIFYGDYRGTKVFGGCSISYDRALAM